MSEKRDLFCVRFGFASVSSFICVSVLCLLWITFFYHGIRGKKAEHGMHRTKTQKKTRNTPFYTAAFRLTWHPIVLIYSTG